MVEVSPEQVARWRMVSMLLATGSLAEPTDSLDPARVVRWFGAMQSQDLASGLYSLGVRLPGWTRRQVLNSISDGSVLRTWPQRGTIHWVAAQDVRWYLDLCGSRALRGAARRRDRLGLSETDAQRAVTLLTEVLAEQSPRSRAELLEHLQRAGIDTAGQRGYHLLWFAAQSGAICLGPMLGSQQSFALLSDWAPAHDPRAREEALADLTLRYFRSHGPTTRQDFAGWTGLTQTDAKTGIRLMQDQLASVQVGQTQMWCSVDLPDRAADPDKITAGANQGELALPAFDEFMLGYKNRAIALPASYADRIIPGGNGMFQPTLVSDGRVVGTWKRKELKTKVRVFAHPFEPLSPTVQDSLGRSLQQFADYLELPLELEWTAN